MMEPRPNRRKGDVRGNRSGFTVPEYLVTIVLAAVVAGMLLQGYLYGARMHVIARAKLTAGDQARRVVADFTHDIRTATSFEIGSMSSTNFVPVSVGQARSGNAIEIYATSETNSFVRYYLEASGDRYNLRRLTVSSNKVLRADVLANALTNMIVFTAEDPWGNVTTNERPSEIVGVNLSFSQKLFFGSGTNDAKSFIDSYQLKAKVNKRTTMGYQG
jgi:hypothetical protein